MSLNAYLIIIGLIGVIAAFVLLFRSRWRKPKPIEWVIIIAIICVRGSLAIIRILQHNHAVADDNYYEDKCHAMMTEYANKKGVNPDVYIIDNQAYLKKCILYLRENQTHPTQ